MNKSFKYLLLLCIAPAAFAFGEFQPIMTISAGPAWENNGNSKTINVSPTIEQRYTVDDGTNTLGQAEIFFASGFDIVPAWHMNFGLALGAVDVATISGHVIDNGTEVGTYSYKVSHLRGLAKDQVLFDFGSPFKPWVSFGVGASFNHAYHYRSDVEPTFRSEIMPTFTYSLGVGFQYAFSEHFQIGMGYEFSDWGTNELDEPRDFPGNDYLSSKHFYTNALMFNFAYSD